MRAPPDYESWPQNKKNEFCAAEAKDWRNATRGKGLGEQEAPGEGVSLDDFNAYMPAHSYIFTPSREMWPAATVNARISPVPCRRSHARMGECSRHSPGAAPKWTA